MTLRLRPVLDSDGPSIYSINLQVQALPWSLDEINGEIAQACPYSVVACDGSGIVVGYLFIRPSGPDFEIISVGVAASWQNKGIGKSLIRSFLGSRPPGTEVYLEVSDRNAAAMAVYRSLGFVSIGLRKGYYRDGSDAHCMKLHLANP